MIGVVEFDQSLEGLRLTDKCGGFQTWLRLTTISLDDDLSVSSQRDLPHLLDDCSALHAARRLPNCHLQVLHAIGETSRD